MMSEKEKAVESALQEAIQEHEPSAVLTGWTFSAQVVLPGEDNGHRYIYTSPPGQSLATTLGLLDLATSYLKGGRPNE